MELFKKESIVEIIKKSGIFLLLFITNILLVTTVLYFFKITITPYHLPVSFILSILVFLLFYKKDNIKINIITLILGTIVFTCILLMMQNVYDVTADGNTYHKLAIGSMKNGWNPNYQDSKDFTKIDGNTFDITEDNINSLWIDHYAKGTEIFAAVIYSFTGNIETGKIYTILLMYITFTIIFSYLYKDKKINLISSIIIPGLLVVNPITIVQIGNYYVDGALALSLFLIIYSCIAIIDNKTSITKGEKFLVLSSAIIWCINVKFTGLGFAAVFCFVFYLYWLYVSHKKGKVEFKKDFQFYTIFYIVTVIVAIGVIGYSSYTRNIIDHGHPMYPLYGKGHVENMVIKEQPSSFRDKNHLEIFLISIFSKGENVSPSYSSENIQPQLKVPFTLSKSEIQNYTIPDIRMSGFGPLFSGVFIISMLGTVYILIKLGKEKKWNIFTPFILIVLTSFILILALDGGYWARYIPYFYTIPIMVLTYFLYDTKLKWRLVIGAVLAITLFINSSLVLKVTYSNIKSNNKYVEARLNEVKQYSQQKDILEVKLNHSGLQGALYNLNDIGIDNYEINNNIESNKEGYFFTY